MAPSHGFAAASHREAALRGAPASPTRRYTRSPDKLRYVYMLCQIGASQKAGAHHYEKCPIPSRLLKRRT
jgi:hypothetical protein